MGENGNGDSSSTLICDIKKNSEAEDMRVHKNVLCSDQYIALKNFTVRPNCSFSSCRRYSHIHF